MQQLSAKLSKGSSNGISERGELVTTASFATSNIHP